MDRELAVDKPIFQQIAEKIESSILEESLPEGDRVPSTNEIAKFYQINPATAAKGINLLVDEGVIYKKRGIGMFVTEGARKIVLQKRKRDFFHDYIVPLRNEAMKIGITVEELQELLQEEES
ncbi:MULTISPECIES: GntR family transcriptional regulator [Pontibacillus]|uniref:GntR family transcriptional regulator n=1 Tax=Pontibacillus chungwhensis TaxID=265426 RepID=A0ABY8V1W0_9BACI|nr:MULTISPECIES: GntR family transcriptional regulator [Pontibacillus]MCD5322343.1 GntR family transcriptional regulator [Pontibacillus sp. HN14]WIF99633.1 GntR family transcriptional regulator [Pontibacillus chungwhensis]